MNRIFPNQDETPNRRTFLPEVLVAMRAFRSTKVWQGTVEERRAKFQTLHTALCSAYGCDFTLNLDLIPAQEADHGRGGVRHSTKEIILDGKLSVVTYLYCFAAIVFDGKTSVANCWAIDLYRRIFPNSAAKMETIEVEGIKYIVKKGSAPGPELN